MSRMAALAALTGGSLPWRRANLRGPGARGHELMREPARLERQSVGIAGSLLAAPVITYLVTEKMWRLETPYSYRDGDHVLAVRAGFEFDLASVPRPLWALIAPFDLSIAAPLVHDFLYRHSGDPPAGAVTPRRTYTRRQADGLFRRIMADEGVWAWRRFAAYLAVRAAGWAAWGR